MDHATFYDIIMKQIKDYLDGNISKEEYYDMAEPFYTQYAAVYKNQQFHDYFINTIAEACLVYIDEPGLSQDERERMFRETLTEAFRELKKERYLLKC